MYGGLVHHPCSVWSSDRISAPSQHPVHYGGLAGGFPPPRPYRKSISRGTGRRNLNAAELFSIYTEFRGLVALSRRGNQPARKVPSSPG